MTVINPPPNYWKELFRLILPATELTTLGRNGVSLLDLDQYLPLVIEQFEEYIEKDAQTSIQKWRDYVGYSRMADVELLTMPQVATALRKFLIDGKMESAFQALAAITELVIREQVRAGLLPSLFPVRHLEPISTTVVRPKVSDFDS
jgi:hypothetical protein